MQFTSTGFTEVLLDAKVRISMDGRSRCIDDRMIERLWRSLKYECVYLNAFGTESEARNGQTGQVVTGQAVVSGGDTAPVLEPSPHPLNDVAPLVCFPIERKGKVRVAREGITALMRRRLSQRRRLMAS